MDGWEIAKHYDAEGILWRVALKGTSHRWERRTEWGDEVKLEYSVVIECAESVIGEVKVEDLRMTLACSRQELRCSETLSLPPYPVQVVCSGDRGRDLYELLGRIIRIQA